jgi:amino acid transporter
MKQVSIFRILTYILVPFAFFFSIVALFSLLMGLANVAYLLSGFISVAFVIYTFASLKFLNRGIDRKQACNPQLKDWIKVNAYVSSVFGLMMVLRSIQFFGDSTALVKEVMEKYEETKSSLPSPFSGNTLQSFIKGISLVMLLMGIALLVHIQMNFRLLKQYAFVSEPQPPAES